MSLRTCAAAALLMLLTSGCGGSDPAPRACAGPSDCTDDDACTVDERCDAASRTCMSNVLDGDGDGEAPLVCGGSDCDDSRAGTRCGGDGGTVDAEQFCTEFQTNVCARDLASGRIDDEQHAECASDIAGMCAGFSFPAGCAISLETAASCQSALRDPARFGTVVTLGNPMLPECTGLCV